MQRSKDGLAWSMIGSASESRRSDLSRVLTLESSSHRPEPRSSSTYHWPGRKSRCSDMVRNPFARRHRLDRIRPTDDCAAIRLLGVSEFIQGRHIHPRNCPTRQRLACTRRAMSRDLVHGSSSLPNESSGIGGIRDRSARTHRVDSYATRGVGKELAVTDQAWRGHAGAWSVFPLRGDAAYAVSSNVSRRCSVTLSSSNLSFASIASSRYIGSR